MVCSVDHLASGAGLAMLRAGGNAVDAAVATSAVLAVTTQHMCGMGGDLFALVHEPGATGPPAALVSVGRAGSGADPERLRAEGRRAMPFRGDIRAVTVPGCVDGWHALHARHGRLPLADLLAPAMTYARDGFPAAPLLAAAVAMVVDVEGAEPFVPDGRAVATGGLVRRPGVARALGAIVAEGRSGFYAGEFGSGLLALGGGEFTADDLARPMAQWTEPVGASVWGVELWTTPPPSQGYLTLLGALVASGLDLPDSPDDDAWAHLLVEAARAAGHDRPARLHEGTDVTPLLADESVGARRRLVDPGRRAALRSPAAEGGTIYLCAVDTDRMGVSLIQSNAAGFGAHIVEPATGIFLQNRGIGFSLEPGHPAEYGPGRRPPHTLSPALVTRPDGGLAAVIGTMGGDAQPQVLLQLITRLYRHGASPGHAISAARWALRDPTGTGFDTWHAPDDAVVSIEDHAPPSWAEGLNRRGHPVEVVPAGRGFGHAHVIQVCDDGAGGTVLAGAADPRALTGAATGL